MLPIKKLLTTISLSVVLSSYLMAGASCGTNDDGDYLVRDSFDSGADYTLRACINLASNAGVDAKVVFERDMNIVLDYTIYINGNNDVTIDGGEHDIIVDGNSTNRIFGDSNSAIITLKNLTLQNGNAGDYAGGAIDVTDAIIENCTFLDNNASYGGAIYSRGDLNITNSTFENNHATGNGESGEGGAIYINQGILDINGVTISGNSAVDDGGAINGLSSKIALWNSTISGNSAGQNAGAIHNTDTNTTIYNTTIVYNNAAGGYAAVMNRGNSKTLVMNSIIYNNNSTYGNDWDSLLSYGYNLFDLSVNITEEENEGSDILSQDPKLGPLRDNGGYTKTHALRGGSPAIDSGNSIYAFDQRGKSRKGAPDIGSYEYQGMTLAPIYMFLF